MGRSFDSSTSDLWEVLSFFVFEPPPLPPPTRPASSKKSGSRSLAFMKNPLGLMVRAVWILSL